MGFGRGNSTRLDPGKVLFKRCRHTHTLRIRNETVKDLLPNFIHRASMTPSAANLFNDFSQRKILITIGRAKLPLCLIIKVSERSDADVVSHSIAETLS